MSTGGGSGSSTPSRPPPPHSSSLLSANLAAHLSKPVTSSASTNTASSDPSALYSTPNGGGIRLPVHASAAQGVKASPIAADSAELAITNSDVWKSSAARRAEKAWAIQSEKTLQTDGKFKKYSVAVEKCLATFESVSEWADFIAFLGRLLKTLQSASQFNAIPRKLIVAKRLSQCLNPALPSGVHQRALEVYEHIFTVIGPEGLRRDLSVWSPGLLPFFQFASTTVKPIVLNSIELHYLPLGQDLRPIAKPLQLALLPGLEEETSEHFERVLKLLDKVKDSIGQPYFLQNFWLLLISVPVARLPALHYLARRLPDLSGGNEKEASKDVMSIVGPDIGLAVRAFSAAMEDDSLLVRRAMLDVLAVKFKLDSRTFKVYVRNEDRIRLLQSALAIVLKRDISLNRRLYAWLLGPSEDISTQQKYFEEHAMQWSRLAILSELNSDVSDASAIDTATTRDRQRPYRILISLLDKWSLGLPMTNALIIDTFKALKRQLDPCESTDSTTAAARKAASSDVSTTAKMLFEAVDPFAMYRQFYYETCKELQQEADVAQLNSVARTSIVPLLRFIFSSFRVHDEESRVVHLPTLFAALIELTHEHPLDTKVPATLQLARDVLALIPKRVFAQRQGDAAAKTISFVKHGDQLYELASAGADEAAKRYVGFQHPDTIADLLRLCAELPLRNEALSVDALTILCQLLGILDSTTESGQAQAKVPWDAAAWMQSMKPVLQKAHSFIEIEACVEAFVAASQCRALQVRTSFSEVDVAPRVVEKLFRHMRPDAGPYHVRSVELLWTVADLAPSTPIGAQLCRRIVSSELEKRQEAMQTFGVLWKFSDDSRAANALLIDPLLSILDGLRSADWLERQLSEAWVRDHAHSYPALLDPLLVMIFDQTAHRCPVKRSVEGQTIESLEYRRPLDHEKVCYAMSVMLQLIHIGGPALGRTIRTSHIARSAHSALTSQATKESEQTYAQFIIDKLLTLLQSDPPPHSPYEAAYHSIQAYAADTLKALLQKAQPDDRKLIEIETVLLQRLLLDIDKGALSAQGRTLQTLHSVVSSRHTTAAASAAVSTSPNAAAVLPPSRLLLSTIKAGLSSRRNRSVLQQWADFVLAITPMYRNALSTLLLPLNQGLCALIRAGMADIQRAYGASVEDDAGCETSEADVAMLLAMSERVLLQSLEQQSQTGSAEGGAGGASGEKGDTFSFMGALSNVFSTEPVATSVGGTGSNAVWKSLHQTVMTLHLAWLSTSARSTSVEDSRQDSLEIVQQSIQARCRRYLERLYRHHSGEVVEALIACWHLAERNDGGPPDEAGVETTFEILYFLAPSAQIVVTFLCDVIATRTNPSTSSTSAAERVGMAGKTGKHMSVPGVPDVVLLAFLEAYLARLDANASVQVWPVVTIFVKDIIGNSAQHKAQIYPTLRCLTVIGETIMDEKSNLTDDRRLKRDLIDHFIRICDLSILIAGRSFEQTTWIGRRTVTADVNELPDGSAPDEKAISASITDLAASSTGSSTVEAIQVYLAKRALPAMRAFALDSDKMIGLSTNIVYYIITPALKAKRRTPDVPVTTVNLLLEVTKLPGTFKTWRTTVSEFFSDNRFFDMDVSSGIRWAPIVFALMTHDKERFIETIGRVSTPSTNIFTNREAETRMRTMNIRRMSYVLFAGPSDYWLTQLPLIQEKLVDLLRNGATVDPAVGEVYLCLRVLLVRFESRHLSGFWPVVMTEMMRLFEGCLDELPSDGSDGLALVEAASRLLDLLVTLQTDEFQIHQWLFITDTVDIVYPPDDWAPDAMLDRLATVIGEKRGTASALHGKGLRGGDRSSSPALGARHAGPRSGSVLAAKTRQARESSTDRSSTYTIAVPRRRLLFWKGEDRAQKAEQAVSTMEELQPFFANLSLHAYESTYASGDAVDWEVIETMLKHALFAGHGSTADDD